MVFLLSIILSFLSNIVDCQLYANNRNYSNHSGISIFDKGQVNGQATALKTKLQKTGNKKLEKNSKYRKRNNSKRYLAISSFFSIDLKNQFSYIIKNNSVQICFPFLNLHPNSLRAPPVFYCI